MSGQPLELILFGDGFRLNPGTEAEMAVLQSPVLPPSRGSQV